MNPISLLLALFLSLIPTVPTVAPVAPQGQPLQLSLDEVPEQHGLILRAIGRGELDAGVARLVALKEHKGASGIAAQIDKDLARSRALIELRAKHFQELVEKGKRVTLERRPGKIVATVTAFADGKLTLAGAKSGEKEITADELLLLPLVREFSAKTLEGVDPSVRGYAFVLAGDAKGIATLKGSPPADELRAEAESIYKGALELGAAAELLSDLAARGKPSDVAAATEVARGVEELAAKFKNVALVTKRRAALASLAASAYALLYDQKEAMEGLSAAVEKLPDGRVRLTYDFKKARRLPDFVADHGYLEDIRNSVNGPTDAARELVLKSGYLRVGGDGVWRHALEFTGPITVTYTFALEKPEQPSAFIMGVHDDRAGSLVMCWCDTLLMARDIPTRFDKHTDVPPTRMVAALRPISTTFTVADGVAYAIEGGKEVSKLDSGPRTSGGLCLVSRGVGDVLFSEIVIESRVDMDALGARWAQKKAAELGL